MYLTALASYDKEKRAKDECMYKISVTCLDNFEVDIRAHLMSALKDARDIILHFWDDMENSQKVMQKIGSLKAKVTGYESLKSDYEDALVMIELADEEGDLSLLDDCTASVKDIETRVEDMTLSTLLSGEFDGKNALLTFHAGAGGTEAQDWAEMLFRMYNRWGERHGYKVSTLDYLDGDVAGIKSATILVEGENAYGYLKGEMGIHRLVRVSPFDLSLIHI